jgi:hypothetical protein
MNKTILALLIVLNTYGCAGFFSIDRTFIDEMERDDEQFFVAERDFRVIPGDTGRAFRSIEDIRRRTPASNYEKKQLLHQKSINDELSEKEMALHGDEMFFYKDSKRYLSSVSEKLYYLSLRPSERKEYISSKISSINTNSSNFSAPIGLAVMKMDREIRPEVTLGMNKNSVERAWGRPYRIDVAGDPAMQNERWLFTVQGESKYVYFENGQVQGWSW